jgi:hypothetical protein
MAQNNFWNTKLREVQIEAKMQNSEKCKNLQYADAIKKTQGFALLRTNTLLHRLWIALPSLRQAESVEVCVSDLCFDRLIEVTCIFLDN